VFTIVKQPEWRLLFNSEDLNDLSRTRVRLTWLNRSRARLAFARMLSRRRLVLMSIELDYSDLRFPIALRNHRVWSTVAVDRTDSISVRNKISCGLINYARKTVWDLITDRAWDNFVKQPVRRQFSQSTNTNLMHEKYSTRSLIDGVWKMLRW